MRIRNMFVDLTIVNMFFVNKKSIFKCTKHSVDNYFPLITSFFPQHGFTFR